jgi:cyclase
MLQNRVIPCLLLNEGMLIKTRKFSDPKYIGDPINAIRIFNEKEVDELIVLDIYASRNNREPDYGLIEQFASECFMPLCYGGGISSLEQAKKLFALGVEKICIQSAAIRDISLITEIASKYGNQAVVVAVDVKRNLFGQIKLFDSAKRKIVNSINYESFMQNVIKAGAGEILLNSVDRDGMMEGVDFQMVSDVRKSISVPLIVMGGIGSLEHIRKTVEAGASAVAAGSFFVYHGPHRAVLITYPTFEELSSLFLK